MGNLKDLASMIPGVGKALKDVDIDDDAFKNIEAIILSMTPKERSTPDCLNTSRRMRIAKGSGTSVAEVNKLIKQFEKTKLMMKKVSRNRGMQGKMMNQLGMSPDMMNGLGGMDASALKGMDMKKLQEMAKKMKF